MPAPDLALSALDGDADAHAYRDIARASFGGEPDKWEQFFERIGRENLRVARRGAEVVGGLAVYPMGQYFGGRSVPMAGYAAVGVAPAERGRGVATGMMTQSLREMRAAGFPISTLYASTQRLYRSVGYEQAGAKYCWQLALDAIGLRERELPLRRVEPDHPAFPELYRRRAEISNGNLDRSDAIWGRTRVVYGAEQLHGYLVGPAGAEEGYAVVEQRKAAGRFGFDLHLRDFVAHTPAAARRLWTLFASHGTIAKFVHFNGAPLDVLHCQLPEQGDPIKLQHFDRWMVRILDVRAALARRGYTPRARGELHLELEDPLFPENAGRFVLRVEGGEALVARGGDGALKATINGLAPLYTGMLAPAELQMAGFVAASPDVLATAAALFAGPQPWMPDHF